MKSSPKNVRRSATRLPVNTLALALWSCSLLTLPAPPAQAQTATLPSGLSVASGQAQVSTAGKRMTVVNTPQAILNWNSFSIGAGATVEFRQTSAASSVLNRVTGNDPSNILGSLSSNGRVWLLNPNGVLFGTDARVDVAGLVAGTLRLSDSDWQAGRYSLTAGNAGAAVVNQGELRSSFGGTIALLGDSVANSGLVLAPGGQIVLAAGSSVELVDTGAPNLAVRVTAPAGEARNLGTLHAAGGRIDIHAAAVNISGIVSADGFASGPGGEVWIQASGSAELTGSSRTSANSGNAADAGTGGSVVVLGQRVGVLDQAQVQADGARGGGSVNIGGGLRGQDPRFSNAQGLYFGPQATISADSTGRGDGGTVVLWSDQSTRAYGSLAARGGLLGGNGGFIETSGGWLDARPAGVSTRAPLGRNGLWLLDPFDITIANTGTTTGFGATTYTAQSNSATLTAATLNAALLTSDITVSTGTGGSQTGAITVDGAQIQTTSVSSLTLQAAGGITLTNGAKIDLASGSITLNAGNGPITVNGASRLVTGGSGSINFTGSATGTDSNGNTFPAASSSAGSGVVISASSSLQAGGAINIGGLALAAGSGVAVDSASLHAGGPITIQGDGRSGVGVAIGAFSAVGSSDSITLWGRGSAAGVSIGGSVAQDPASSSLLEIVGRSTSSTSPGFELLGGQLTIDSNSTSAFIAGYNAGGRFGTTPGISLISGSVVQAKSNVDFTTFDSAAAGLEKRQPMAAGGQITISGSGTAVTMNASRLTLDGASVSSAVAATLSTTTADGITVNNSSMSLGGTISAISLDAGTGPIAITGNTTITTTGNFNSQFTAGGQGTGSSAVGTGTGSGVLISDTASITSGTITLRGRATGTGDGVRMTGGTLNGVSVNINGTGVNGNGFSFSGTNSLVQSSDSLAISGSTSSSGNGVIMIDGQIGQSGVGSSSITGSTLSAGTGVVLGSGLRFVSNTPGSGFYVTGTETSGGNQESVLISGATINLRERVNITSPCGDCDISITGSTIASRDGLLIDTGGGAVSFFNIVNSSISASFVPGELRASYQFFVGTNTFTAVDTELRFMQANGTAPTQPFFDNQGTMNMVNSGTGRWVVFATNINSSLFLPGNLANAGSYDFKRYGATGASSWASDVGNGFASLTTASASFSGAAQSRVYDSTRVATFNTTTLSGAVGGDSATGSFSDKNVGTGKTVTVGVQDSNSKPVYGYTLNTTGATLTADITAKALPVTGLTVQNKVYDSTDAAQILGTATVAPLGSDVVTASVAPTGFFPSKSVGTNLAVTPFESALGGTDAGNYFLTLNLRGDITALPISASGLVVQSKVYDGNTAAALSGAATVTPLSGDVLTITGNASGSFANKTVGTAKPVTVSGLTLGGTDAANYLLQSPALTADITPLALSATGLSALSRSYDATTPATISGTATVAALGSDSVAVGGSASGSFADKNVGNNKRVTPTGLTLTGPDAGNYTLQLPSLFANITPRAVTAGGLTAANKVYDGSTSATLLGTAAASFLSGDGVGLSGQATGSFADKNVGNGKAVTVGGLSLVGADAANYALQLPALSANIAPLDLALPGLSAASRVYDGSTVAQITGTTSISPLAGDSVQLGGAPSGSFADKNVGSNKPVTVGGLTLAGNDAGNYRLQASGLSASITPFTLTLAGLSAQSRAYDGTVNATLAGTPALAALGSDSLSVSGTANSSFADKNVGSNKPVTVSGLSLAGADAGNYVLQLPAFNASITPRPVSFTGLAVAPKVYDASTAATLSGTAGVQPLPGDSLTVGGTALATFIDKNVGNNKAVTVGGLNLTGPDAGNYTLQDAALKGSITPRPLQLAGLIAADKVYDATTNATLNGNPVVAALAGDSLALSGSASGRFIDKNVGTGKAVAVSGLVLAGADAGNYALQLPALNASIRLRAVSLTGLAAAPKVYDATAVATLSGSASVQALPGDSLAVGGTALASFADKSAGNDKAVTVSGLKLTGSDAANYALQLPVLSSTVTPRPVSLTGLSAVDKVYDGSSSATLQGNPVLAALTGDVLTLAGSATARFADAHAATAKPVSISGWSLAGSDAGNYTLALPQLAATISPATLSYVATPTQRVRGEPVGVLAGTVAGFAAGETLASATSGTLRFTTPATETSELGSYAITGSGLQARDYVFGQAPGNVTAYTVIPVPVTPATPTVAAVTSTVVASSNSGGSAAAALAVSAGAVVGSTQAAGTGNVGVLDVSIRSGASAAAAPGPITSSTATPAEPAASVTGAAVAVTTAGPVAVPAAAVNTFAAVRLASLSAGELSQILADRNAYTEQLFAQANRRLTADPALADVRACRSLDEATAGKCIVTPELKSRLAATGAGSSGSLSSAAGPAAVSPMQQPPQPPLPATAASPAPAAPQAATTPAAALPVPAAEQRRLAATKATVARVARLQDQRRTVQQAVLPQIQRKLAIVIGVGNYEDASIPTLSNAVRDAQAVAQTLESRLGYETVVLENASKADIVAVMNRVALTAGASDSVIVYFAGHGELVAATQQGYWLPADSDAQKPETWLSNADINRLVAQIGASQVALISDSCYSGTLASEERLRAGAETLNPELVLGRKSVVVMSSGGNQPVADEGRDGHSPFAYYLIENLAKLDNWQAGGNVFERVRFAVARALPQRPQYSASRSAGHQPGGEYLFEQRKLGPAGS